MNRKCWLAVWLDLLVLIHAWGASGWESEQANPDLPLMPGAAVVFKNQLYLGPHGKLPQFESGLIRRYGQRWSPPGGGIQGQVHAPVICGDQLYGGGEFRAAGGQPAQHFARWRLE